MVSPSVYIDIADRQWPIIYRPEYDVKFWGLEKLHPFDAGKWGRIFQHLKSFGLIDDDTVTTPNEVDKQELLHVHTNKYLKSLKCSLRVALIAELAPICLIPNCIVQSGYLRPMRYQTGGSILAGKLALERGWAINLGGGFHHCSASKGGGFCPYADITLLVKFVFDRFESRVRNVMVVDLDAHQGNGYERDFIGNDKIYILDIFNRNIYPGDKKAKKAINRIVELENYTEDVEYLSLVHRHLKLALSEFKPDLIVYNAGTDILQGDSLGRLSVSPEGIIRRDELVFSLARAACVPIVMLTSGGYLRETALVIARSIQNLDRNGLIIGPSKA